jgi:putative ABC transport system substrate-binding protein
MFERRAFLAALGGAAAWPVVARGQQPAMPVVGLIGMRSTNVYEPFKRGLSEIGFDDHRNVFIDYREASNVDQLPSIAIEMVGNKVAAISAATPAIIAAKAGNEHDTDGVRWRPRPCCGRPRRQLQSSGVAM